MIKAFKLSCQWYKSCAEEEKGIRKIYLGKEKPSALLLT